MAKDLREFIASYERDHPEDVVRITKPVKAEFEVTAINRRFEMQDKYPLLIFEQVINTKGQISPFPLITNVLGDRRKLAYAIGSNFYDVAIDWANKVDKGEKIPPVIIGHDEAPCQENIIVGDKIDILDLPALRHHEMDPGPYTTAGLLITHDPETWTPNVAFHRGFFAGPREIRCYLTQVTHNALNLAAHEEMNKEMKVAYCIGHHPAVIMGLHVKLAYPGNHYICAGSVTGEPLRVVPSVTLGDDFLVPADAEIIIEGIIRPGRRALEGPFGEFTRYYGPQQMSPVIEVTAVTHRNGAIWHSFMVGMNNNYAAVRMERHLYQTVKKAVPQVQRVALPTSGSGNFHVYIQIRKTNDGQPKQAIMAALSAAENSPKHAIVVDEDIDIYDDRSVLWAVATRSQWDRDLVVIPGCQGSDLEPSASRDAVTAKGGIDATKPAPPGRFPVKVNVPERVLEQVDLADYVDPAKLAQVPQSKDR